MLIQTKRIKDNLISCGVKKSDVRVYTPFNMTCKGYDKTRVCLLSNQYNKARYILRFRKYFNLIITTHGADISHIIFDSENLDELKNGRIKIYNIVKDEFKTLGGD
jgi:hypothetical protein